MDLKQNSNCSDQTFYSSSEILRNCWLPSVTLRMPVELITIIYLAVNQPSCCESSGQQPVAKSILVEKTQAKSEYYFVKWLKGAIIFSHKDILICLKKSTPEENGHKIYLKCAIFFTSILVINLFYRN